MSHNDTASDTGRDYEIEIEIETSQPFAPNDAWVDEFEKQLTPSLIDRLRKYARPRALSVAYAGRKVDTYYTRELVPPCVSVVAASTR